MNSDERLHGSCSCGRYNYIIHIPADRSARSQAQVHFGTGNANRQSHSSILSAWLKVPLTWYQSATVSFYDDEPHEHIARTFTPIQQPGSQRKFCGFCGAHISYWTEEPISEQDYMNITIGSLTARDLLALEDLNLLPEDVDLASTTAQDVVRPTRESEAVASPSDRAVAPFPAGEAPLSSSRSGNTGGISWFENMIEGSQLGQHSKRRHGHGVSADGSTTVSWEVSEYYDEGGDENEQPRSKRKAVDIAEDDTTMRG